MYLSAIYLCLYVWSQNSTKTQHNVNTYLSTCELKKKNASFIKFYKVVLEELQIREPYPLPIVSFEKYLIKNILENNILGKTKGSQRACIAHLGLSLKIPCI